MIRRCRISEDKISAVAHVQGALGWSEKELLALTNTHTRTHTQTNTHTHTHTHTSTQAHTYAH